MGDPPGTAFALTGNIMTSSFGAVDPCWSSGWRRCSPQNTTLNAAIRAKSLTVTGYIADVAVRAASIHTVGGIVLPFIGVAMMTQFREKRSAASGRPTVSTPPCSRVLRVGDWRH